MNFGFKHRQTTQVIDTSILAMFCVKELAREWAGGGERNKMPFCTNKYKVGIRGVASLKPQHDCKRNLE